MNHRYGIEAHYVAQKITLGTIQPYLEEVHGYAGHVDDWKVINRELLKVLPPAIRPKVKDLRVQLSKRWSEMTGRPVIFTADEMP